MLVAVLDGTSKEDGIPLGGMSTPYSGGPKHRYVLVREESFALRLGRDVVAALRARGYRAELRSDAGGEALEGTIILTIKPVRHSIDVAIGRENAFVDGVFVFDCVATMAGASSVAWSDTVDHHLRKEVFGPTRAKGVARKFEGVYWSAVVEVVHRFGVVLPPSP